MGKIIDFIKARYKVLIPIMVIFVLLVAVYFFYREYRYDNYRNKQEISVYQYFNGLKVEYKTQIVYNLKDIIVDINPINRKINYEKTPIYYKDEDKIIFPQDMNIAFPLKNGGQFRLYKNAIYTYDDEVHKISNNADIGSYDHFFLYNGEDLYFFPDEVTLKIGNKEYAKLGKMSFIKIVGGNTLEYYDKENNKAEFIELKSDEVTVYNESMNVNLTEAYILSYNKKILLFNPQNLKGLSDWLFI